ncbi:hypothetical protein RFI_22952 [Reticulomyxa filosa]|uniref:Uncharacterized protein n=1 Tax=Reticulomyxa filosa TaxID=46433 RepID=X6MLC4_RETFI|nr:hypothetical protein RFI_22952 [Reticulomyxa filosa]|eukprot:ETO14416.1 hypothetical protein RFI_22952 [Reticulomyxa filosa]
MSHTVFVCIEKKMHEVLLAFMEFKNLQESALKILTTSDNKCKNFNIYKLNFKQAIQLFCLALYVKLQTLHYSHIDGRAHDNKGEYGKATKLYKKSLKIKLDIFESDHIDIATLYNDLGYVYCNKKEYNKTIEYFENALKVCKNIFENLDERMLLGFETFF